MIYLDNNSTTRVDPRVVDAMMPFFSETYGNAASSTHELGRCAKQAVDDARSVIANSIGAQPDEIVFTSGATESNNLAIRGVCTHRSNRSNRVATLATEHRAVLDPVNRLANEGFETIILSDTTPDGLLESLSSMADNPPALVSIMAANNE
ncbi:MAG: aminotransferase class V-fold PLP-dependent enzyme, partial [Planctomycetota bacterium]|nr:aminotransferase class V-fold PLP-dependent enzyme [Planctomycetota bacterium]